MTRAHDGELEPGFVLHHRPFRDTSLIVDVFTRAHGRVGLVARSARGPRSRFRGVLQPFRPLLLSWRLRGELGTLVAVEAAGPVPPPAAGDRLLSMFYVNELVLRLTGRLDPHPELYDAYARVMEALGGVAALAPALRIFEVGLLESLGYGIDLAQDVAGRPVLPETTYRYDPQAGLAPCPQDLAGAISGASLLALGRGEPATPRELSDALRLTRAALDVHLGERGLRSRDLLARLRR
jgi:DNA repair protein RecO (recombination protein O)